MIEATQAKALSSKIDEVRQRAGVEKGFKLKFNPGPVGMPHEDFIRLKQDVLEAAINHGAKLLTYLTLHDLAREPDVARRYGINTVCYHFHCALNRTQTPGLVLIDRFNDAGNAIDAHLSDKFSTGVQLNIQKSQCVGDHRILRSILDQARSKTGLACKNRAINTSDSKTGITATRTKLPAFPRRFIEILLSSAISRRHCMSDLSTSCKI